MTDKYDLSVLMAPGLRLINPVMTASGTFGYGNEYGDLVDIQKLGAIICKGTTLEPRDGNAQPRIIEVAAGILNSVGLQNIGVEALVKEQAPVWAGWSVPVIVNIAGDTVEEYAKVASQAGRGKGHKRNRGQYQLPQRKMRRDAVRHRPRHGRRSNESG